MTHPFELLADRAPSLRGWWDDFKQDEEPLDDSWIHLAYALADTSVDGRIPDLPSIAPLLDSFLAQYDDRDQVSLGFVEPLQHLVEERRLDAVWIRDALGAVARRHWDALFNGSSVAIDWAAVAGADTGEPAVLMTWLVQPGDRVLSGTTLAGIQVAGTLRHLVVSFPCIVGRLVAAPGIGLSPGDRLLYVTTAEGTPRPLTPPHAVLA
jgi:hypothetical protein